MKITTTPNGRFVICDTIDEFAGYCTLKTPQGFWSREWQGGMSTSEAIQTARKGHMPSVEESEKYLKMFEDLSFTARKWSIVPDVAGGAVNVAAHLAGTPLAMRRRQRQVSESAPLNVFCDVVSSASIHASYLKKRGAAVVALVRMLGATRPVTLWMVGAMGSYGYNPDGNGWTMVRMPEVADLSRSAFCLAHPAAARGMLYHACETVQPKVRGAWAFNDVERYRRTGLAIYSSMVQANPEDSLYVPPPYHMEDTIVPEKWLPEMLKRYGVVQE